MDYDTDKEIGELHNKMLRKQLWVVMTKPVAPPAEVQKHLAAHLKHQIALEKKGILYGAGPATAPGYDKPSFGLVIIRAKDADEARKIADSDPMHASGVREYQLYQWSMNEGRLTLTIDFSDRSYRLD